MFSNGKPVALPPSEGPVARLRWLTTRPWLVCLFLGALTLLCFWPVTRAGFINYDDQEYVTENPQVLTGLTWNGVVWSFYSTHASNWHPLTWLSHMLDVSVFGPGPFGPHIINLLLHIANSILLFLVLSRMTAAVGRSAIVAALFAIHPVHVESVAWISERKDVLSTFFFLLALMSYVRLVQRRLLYPTPPRGLRALDDYALPLACHALGLMCKPMLVTLPCVLLLLDFWPLGRVSGPGETSWARRVGLLVLEKAPFLTLSTVSCLVTVWVQRGAIQPIQALPLPERVANALVSYARYCGKALWPTALALPYPHPGRWPAEQVILAALLLAAVSVWVWSLRRTHPFLLTGWFWFLGTLVPVIGLVQVGIQSMADRYTYIPLIGLFIAGVWFIAQELGRRRLRPALGCAITLATLAICGMLTRQQSAYWHDSEKLFLHSAAVTENNYVALSNVGGSLFERQRLDEAQHYFQRALQANPTFADAINSIGAIRAAKGDDESAEWFRKALLFQPGHAKALFNMGNAMSKRGDYTAAVDYFRSSLKVNPLNYEAHNNLACALVKLRRLEDATAHYQLALEGKKDDALIYKNLASALADQGRLDEAILNLKQALRCQKTNDPSTHYSLGLALAIRDRWEEAIQQYTETLRLTPANAEAEYNLGYALRVRKRLDEAAAHLAQAIQLRPEFPLAHYNLGCVLADQGRREEAVAHLREALRQKPDYHEAAQKLLTLEAETNLILPQPLPAR